MSRFVSVPAASSSAPAASCFAPTSCFTPSSSADSAEELSRVAPERKRCRGRPKGKVLKLTAEQKRATNKNYERERRADIGTAFQNLEAAIPREVLENYTNKKKNSVEVTRSSVLCAAILTSGYVNKTERRNYILRDNIAKLQEEIRLFTEAEPSDEWTDE